ncbi:MAG: sulfotransferase domain-containing protein [Opitutales bacterium]
MALPNVIIAGQGKSGTSTLYEVLKAHPEAFVPLRKETGFLSYPEQFFYGEPFYERNYFREYNGEKIIVDTHSSIMFFPENPRNIFELLGPEVKFVFTLRDPIIRALSHYDMALLQLRESLSFKEAVRREAHRYSVAPKVREGMSYIGRGYYASQIESFLEYYPKEQMYFMIFEEEITQNQLESLIGLYDFLGIDPDLGIQEPIARNSSKKSLKFSYNGDTLSFAGKRYISPSPELVARAEFASNHYKEKLEPGYERSIYQVFYADEIERLEGLIGRDLSAWKRS